MREFLRKLGWRSGGVEVWRSGTSDEVGSVILPETDRKGPPTKGQTDMDDVKAAVTTLVDAVVSLDEGLVTGIQIDIQPNGELPFRIYIADETLPVAGLASVEVSPEGDARTLRP
jgi:hypothetical protein